MSNRAFRRVHAQAHQAHVSAVGVGFHLRLRFVGSLQIGLRRPLPQGFHTTPYPIVIWWVFVHRPIRTLFTGGFTRPHIRSLFAEVSLVTLPRPLAARNLQRRHIWSIESSVPLANLLFTLCQTTDLWCTVRPPNARRMRRRRRAGPQNEGMSHPLIFEAREKMKG